MGNTELNHILFIDPLTKLSFKKDSSLQLALSLKEIGRNVFLVFEEDFYFNNSDELSLRVFPFTGEFEEDGCYLAEFSLGESEVLKLGSQTVLHMRIDPPFDSRYLRYLWMLKGLQEKHGVRVVNDPRGIAANNEKMICYELKDSVNTYVGSSEEGFIQYFKSLKENKDFHGLILKPLDLFQGIGVEKLEATVNEEEATSHFNRKREEYGGPVVAQPFLPSVYKGEIRSLFFNGIELGSIIKIPPEGEFLANIAQGAKYEKVELEEAVFEKCRAMSVEFANKGVPWIAYDILGDSIQEANLTCPGLLVEVSKAHGKNLAIPLVEELENYLFTR